MLSILPAQGPSEVTSVFDALSLLVIIVVICALAAIGVAAFIGKFPKTSYVIGALALGAVILNGVDVLFR